MQYVTCNATRPLSRCCWRSVHDSGETLGLSKILAMPHRVMLLKFVLYSGSIFCSLLLYFVLGP